MLRPFASLETISCSRIAINISPLFAMIQFASFREVLEKTLEAETISTNLQPLASVCLIQRAAFKFSQAQPGEED
jgi:hypothetical protein